ncbi:hypothetical protein IAQ61_007847 [Plenodomus lingam]|uniref:uncharacterized protein n=1 Tax=Leptosphaeria maculans TaxID=5022 RepID=UPI0033277183|nr:hypothetical protein IAQ61_007847 [Plenodomus lingam]
MASSTKKRPKSPSTSQATPSKRVRKVSSSASHPAPSKRQTFKQKASCAKSVFRGKEDPYFPSNDAHAASLPTSDDWRFRVKVISSSTDLNNDLFKEAVQGLVKICFPQGVLETLGIQVLEEHMHTENAPEENIRKMVQIFRAEMAHRVTWMLAEYMDTSVKLEAGVEAIVAASANLHGSTLGDDVLGDVVAGMHRLRERIPSNSTHELSNGAVFQESAKPSSPIHLEASDKNTGNLPSGDIFDLEQSASETFTPTVRKRKEKSKARELDMRGEETPNNAVINVDTYPTKPASMNTPTPALMQREKKISTSWKWDILPQDVAFADVSDCFNTAADLFAYHALPLAKKKFGTAAKRKELRHRMEAMLEETPLSEYEKWMQSYSKLIEGDRTMLIRAEANTISLGRSTTGATPAPIDIRHVRESRKSVGHSTSQEVGRSEKTSTRRPNQNSVKDEAVSNVSVIETNSLTKPQAEVTASTTAVRNRSVEACVHGAQMDGGKGFKAKGTQLSRNSAGHSNESSRNLIDATGSRAAGATLLSSQTPIVDLLLGFSAPCSKDVNASVESLITNFAKRSSLTCMKLQKSNGTTRMITLQQLRKSLHGRYKGRAEVYNSHTEVSLRRDFEKLFIPWVIESHIEFPELKQHVFMFAHLLPGCTPVFDILCDPMISLKPDSVSVVKASIVMALHQKGLSIKLQPYGRGENFEDEIASIIFDTRMTNSSKRHHLDRASRHIAFLHRKIFPELKGSDLAKTWETISGLSW